MILGDSGADYIDFWCSVTENIDFRCSKDRQYLFLVLRGHKIIIKGAPVNKILFLAYVLRGQKTFILRAPDRKYSFLIGGGAN